MMGHLRNHFIAKTKCFGIGYEGNIVPITRTIKFAMYALDPAIEMQIHWLKAKRTNLMAK